MTGHRRSTRLARFCHPPFIRQHVAAHHDHWCRSCTLLPACGPQPTRSRNCRCSWASARPERASSRFGTSRDVSPSSSVSRCSSVAFCSAASRDRSHGRPRADRRVCGTRAGRHRSRVLVATCLIFSTKWAPLIAIKTCHLGRISPWRPSCFSPSPHWPRRSPPCCSSSASSSESSAQLAPRRHCTSSAARSLIRTVVSAASPVAGTTEPNARAVAQIALGRLAAGLRVATREISSASHCDSTRKSRLRHFINVLYRESEQPIYYTATPWPRIPPTLASQRAVLDAARRYGISPRSLGPRCISMSVSEMACLH